jgi:hypothetical protein
LREAVHSGNTSWDDWAWHKELSKWKPVHAVIPIIHAARCGKEIGQFEEEQDILSGLRDGGGSSRCGQSPAGRKSWSQRGADGNVVVHIHDRCLARACSVNHVVRLPVPVKVGSRNQRPAAGQSWPKSAPDERWSR